MRTMKVDLVWVMMRGKSCPHYVEQIHIPMSTRMSSRVKGTHYGELGGCTDRSRACEAVYAPRGERWRELTSGRDDDESHRLAVGSEIRWGGSLWRDPLIS